MGSGLETVKHAALETYVTLCSREARRIRRGDVRFEPRCVSQEDEIHARAALAWLCRAQDMGTDDGVSAVFSLVEGWMGSYPETTGYIIPTMFDAAERFDFQEYRDRAVEMAEWLLLQQSDGGGFPGLYVGRLSEPRVFNTGQIVLGLLRAAAETGESRFLESAVRAGDWLVGELDADGAWRRSTLAGVAHAYNVRTAWALVELAFASAETRFLESGLANAKWTSQQQDGSGWFRQNTFSPTDRAASLHTIGYVIRGLLEVGAATGHQEYVECAERAASALHRGWRLYKSVGGAYGPDWSVPVAWRCLPGEAQLAIVWFRLDQLSGANRYRSAGSALLERVKAAQILDGSSPDVYGGISGSVPINGGYERYCLVSWGPKFLIDALVKKTENRKPKTENRKQKTESRRQNVESRQSAIRNPRVM